MGKATFVVTPGERFGRGVILAEIRIQGNQVYRGVRLRCDCGNIYEVRLGNLLNKKYPVKSCGCLQREWHKEGKLKHGLARHDGSQHPLYVTWADMMNRCYNPKVRSYRDYGARGITVCERWHDPALFVKDIEATIGPRPDGMTLDRSDNDSEYGPGKVRWATRAEQVRNSRRFVDGKRSGPVYQLWHRIIATYPGEVCEAWQDFSQFAEDIQEIGPRPEGLFFRRIDLNRPYEPGNVRWSRSPR